MIRGFRSTLLLLIVLVGLVAYIYFVDRNQPLGDTVERDAVFAALEADDLEELEIRAEDGETTRLRKMDDAWRIVEPVSADADAAELSTIASSLADMEIQSVVEEDAADLMRFGLEPARIEVALRESGEEGMPRLLIGNRTPTGSDTYAKLAESRRVFLISSFLDDTFNRNTFALRDKHILKFDRTAVETLTMTRGSTVFEFARSAGDWDILRPIQARGEYGAIQSVVERLASAEMQRIADPDAADVREYGLDRPTATIVVTTGSAQTTLTLGRTEDALMYAKDASRPMVFAVAPTIETDLFKELEDFRRRDLFDSRSFTATRAEFTRGAETVVFEKVTRDEMDVWQRAGGGEVDAMTIDDLLGHVTGLRAVSFSAAAHPSLKSPALTARITFNDGMMETVTLSRAGDQAYASRSDERGTATVGAAAVDDAVKALEAVTP